MTQWKHQHATRALVMAAVWALAMLPITAFAELDASKLKPIAQQLLVLDPPAGSGGVVLQNYQAGGFTSTMSPTDLTKTPHLVNQGKGVNLRTTNLGSAPATLKVSNCYFHDITTVYSSYKAGDGTIKWDTPHADGIFETANATNTGLNLIIEDCVVAGVWGEAIHVDGGAHKQILVQRCRMQSRDGDRITIKLQTGCVIQDLTILDTTGNLWIDASHVAPADIPKLLPRITLGGFSGTVQVTMHVGTSYPAVSAAAAGLTINGQSPTPPSPLVVPGGGLPTIPGTITGLAIFYSDRAPEWHPSDGSSTAAKLTGVWASTGQFLQTAQAMPAGLLPADAQIAALKADVDAQAAIINTLKNQIAAAQKDLAGN